MKESFIETKVMYTITVDDKFYIVENVPARVCRETGEQFFSPETVEHLQKLIRGRPAPKRTIETPVLEYA
jgi:YgiT-type zinc finger domain-containing protein